MSQADAQKLEIALKTADTYLAAHPDASPSECDKIKRELEVVANPILSTALSLSIAAEEAKEAFVASKTRITSWLSEHPGVSFPEKLNKLEELKALVNAFTRNYPGTRKRLKLACFRSTNE